MKINPKKMAPALLVACLIAQTAFVCTITNAQLALIWDLDGTLFRRNQKCIASALGQWNALRFYAKHGNKTESIIEHTLFDILRASDNNGSATSDPAQTTTGQDNNKNKPADDCNAVPCSTSGAALPVAMQKWFDGSKSGAEILAEAQEASMHYDRFLDQGHRELMDKILLWMFRPDTFASCMKPISKAVALLKECAQERDSKGNCPNKLYVLSNLDAETFDALYNNKHNGSVFKYFDQGNLFISARMGDFKPRASIYKEFLKRNNLKADECILIDNQKENIDGALKCGIKGIFVNNGDYRHVRAELEKLGAL